MARDLVLAGIRKRVTGAGKAAGALALCTALAAAPISEARAGDVGAALAGGAVGFALGVMTGNAMARNPGAPPRQYQRQQKPRAAAPVRQVDQTVVNIQTALKFFGFYKGGVDGLNGPGTRRAVAAFQESLDLPPTGTLTQVQYNVLMQVYAETKANGTTPPTRNDAGVDQLFAAISRTPDDGTLAQAPAATTTPAAAPATAPATASTSANVLPVTSAPASTAVALAAIPAAAATLATTEIEAPSLDYGDVCIGRHPVKKADIPASETALRKHFCQTYAAATDAGNVAIEAAGSTDMDVMLQQCGKVRDAVEDTTGDYATADPTEEITRLSGLYAAFPADVKAKAAQDFVVCTGVGLNSGDTGIVDAASLALAALGRDAYLEFVAASLAIGIGQPRNAEAAERWYRLIASRPAAQGGPDTTPPLLTAADLVALGDIADQLKGGGTVQLASVAESSLIPRFDVTADKPATEPAPAAPAVSAPPVQTALLGNGAGALASVDLRKALSNADIAALIRDSIVVVFDPRSGSSGTGFTIGPNFILTNAHVVMEAERVVVASRRYGVRAAKVIAKGMTNQRVGIDAAVLENVNWTADRHLSFHSGVAEGEAVAIGGFPDRASQSDRSSERFFQIITQSRIPSIDDIPAPKFDFGHVQSVFINAETGLQNLQEGLETSAGNSGSPVTNACGDVVGLHYAGTRAVLTVSGGKASGDTSKYNYAITSGEVAKFLKSINIRYSEIASPCR